MILCVKTNADNADFKKLVALLDEELAIRDGIENDFYAQFNKIDAIKYAIVAYENEIPVGCGAIKPFSEKAMEVKRMFILPEKRGKGIASVVLKELESWAKELGNESCVLETGNKQPEAIELYKKSGYVIIPNYGQYIGVENSICFRKQIR
ncbi:MAG TPA: GNAT family N-acetyltransferase [Chitinophagales bacterium]